MSLTITVDGVTREMTPEEVADLQVAQAAPALQRETPMWRIRVILAGDGVLSDIDTAVQAHPDPTIWERWRPGGAPNFVPDSQLVGDMIAAFAEPLGLTQEYIDSVRERAVALED